MKYKMSVREFLYDSKEKKINYEEFLQELQRELESLQKKLSLFQNIVPSLGVERQQSSLYGLPLSVKDCICVKGVQSCAGSKILQGYIPPFDATSVARAKKQGALIIGKTNQDEFGFGTFSVNSGFGIPKNPNDPTRSCGGSSGGAAGVTKALEMPHIALAESTGGSISCPASFCGIVGLTPTYGLVSRYGLIDYANSLDKIGVMGKEVYDTALGLSVIAGHDSKDSTSFPKESEDYTKYTEKDDLKGVRIAVPKEYFTGIEKEVEKSVWSSIEKLQELGAKYKEVSLPTTKFALAAYYIIATSEASTNLAKYSGMRYGLHEEIKGDFNEYFSSVRSKGLGQEAKRRIMLGTFARMSGYRDAYYLRAMKVRTLIIKDFQKVFKNFDIIAAPTMPILPPKFSDIEKLSPLEHYQMDILTVPCNLAGIPHLSIPCKKTGLPVGLHLLGNHFQEGKMIEVAAALEKLVK